MRRITILLITVLISGCTQSTSTIPTSDSKGKDICAPLMLTDSELSSIGFTDAVASVRTVPVKLNLVGTIQANPNLTTPINSLVPGRIENVFVQHGDVVRKGQILAQIRSDEVGELESDYLSKLVDLDSQRKTANLQLALKQKIYDRRAVLLSEKIAARAEFELAESDLEEARLDLAAIDEKIQAAYRSTKERIGLYGLSESELNRLNKARTIKAVFDVVSPRAGIIIDREADPGEMVESGKNLFEVSDLSHVWLVAQVFEKDLRFMRKYLPVEVVVDSFPDEKFYGLIDFVGAQIDPESRTLNIRATISNPGIRLKPEMFAEIVVQTGLSSGLVIPQASVQTIGEVSVVYIVKDKNHFEERQIRTGQTSGDLVEVTQGLKPGERVVVKGSLQLLGQSVKRAKE
ncbi:MAG: efflux RND transporter periplasmic adaptor subunit [Candidatus Obscuribacterales bacterium]|nr:efflux RND transporter periplasmic adaptor subunit [Candidatus Obscuribacterales bacterium]